MFKKQQLLPGILFALLWLTSSLYAEIIIYFAPNGGFAPMNKNREIVLKTGEKVAPTLNNALLDLIERTEEGGQIKIAMYAFGDQSTQEKLIEAAKTRNVKVKVILDGVAEWTTEIRAHFKQRVMEEIELAKQENRQFDFQLKEIYSQAMVDRDRTKTLTDGTEIYGTMHEKFGIIIPKNQVFPIHAFCGSANISWSAGHVFAENRVIFRYEPAIGRQLAEEFARLWNEYGTAVTPNCQSEKYIAYGKDLGELQIISNSRPINEVEYQRIDNALTELMEKVDPENGTIDVAMFSFTHVGLASRIVSLAARYPKIKVRVLMDQTQIQDDENHQGVLGPFIERSAHSKGLKNVEVRYKWRSNAYFWDEETSSCQLIHWRNLLLHHKCVVVNGKLMGIGSYNWSGSAEHRNFENIMIFNGLVPEQQDGITRFLAEYNLIWNSLKKEGAITEKLPNPQVIEGPRGRALIQQITEVFNDEHCRFIMKVLDTNSKGCTLETLAQITGMDVAKTQEKVALLEKATLIFAKDKVYQLAD